MLTLRRFISSQQTYACLQLLQKETTAADECNSWLYQCTSFQCIRNISHILLTRHKLGCGIANNYKNIYCWKLYTVTYRQWDKLQLLVLNNCSERAWHKFNDLQVLRTHIHSSFSSSIVCIKQSADDHWLMTYVLRFAGLCLEAALTTASTIWRHSYVQHDAVVKVRKINLGECLRDMSRHKTVWFHGPT